MRIEVFEIMSANDKVYLELLEQYKTNLEVKAFLDESIIPSGLVLMGNFSLKRMIKQAIDMNIAKVHLVKDIDNNTFLWVVGKFVDNGEISMYPLLKEQPKELQLAIRSALVEKGLFKKSVKNDDL